MKLKFPLPNYQAIPLSPDDSLFVEAITGVNNVVLNIQGTAINLQGDIINFNETLNVSTPGTLFTKVCGLGYSYLLSACVSTFNLLIPDGDCFVRLSLINPFTVSPFFRRKILDQGYVSTYSGIGYGSGSVSKRSSDPWFVYTALVSNPAAGSDFLYSIPSFVQAKFIMCSFTLATSATVASRSAQLRFQDPTSKNFDVICTNGLPASTTSPYLFCNSSNAQVSALGKFMVGCPTPYLAPGSNIRSLISNIQAGDQLSLIAIQLLLQTVSYT